MEGHLGTLLLQRCAAGPRRLRAIRPPGFWFMTEFVSPTIDDKRFFLALSCVQVKAVWLDEEVNIWQRVFDETRC